MRKSHTSSSSSVNRFILPMLLVVFTAFYAPTSDASPEHWPGSDATETQPKPGEFGNGNRKPTNSPGSDATETQPKPGETTNSPEPNRGLVIVAHDVEDAELLVGSVGSNVEVIHLNGDGDFIAQVGEALATRDVANKIASLHLLTHGAVASLRVAKQVVDERSLWQRSSELAKWKDSLSDNADILLYGCEVATEQAGRSFVSALSELTGADVAASSDRTGHGKDADWEFEVRHGKVETAIPFSSASMTAWHHQLITVGEPPDHSQTLPGTAHTLTLGTNTISGQVSTPGDTQDNFRVVVPSGLQITAVVLTLNTGGGFSGFGEWIFESRTSSGSFTTGLPAAAGTYSARVAANFSIGNSWSMTFTTATSGCTGSADCSDGIECTSDVCTAGVCSNPFLSAGTSCGSGSNTTCTNPDTCNGAGSCLANDASNGTTCSAGAFCTAGDSCSSGTCVEGVADPCMSDEKCDEPTDTCFLACGDGVMDPGESCDDGVGNSDTVADACRTDCTLPSCGDNVTDSGEACDAGGNTAGCDSDCTVATCGDSFLNTAAGEACDTGGNSASCDNDCTAPVCGDSLFNIAAGEACDTGGNSASCDNDCTAPTCGDNYANAAAGEDCDDGGVDSANCDFDCTASTCGDSYANAVAGEDCDDGNVNETDTCLSSCIDSTCGDGFLQSGAEECDDGNNSDGDFCNAICELDSDGDNISDEEEVDDDDLGTDATDTDQDETPDYLDEDSDGDGIRDEDEAGDDDLSTAPLDSDRDGIPDYRDLDSDDDGVPDVDEAGDADLATPPVDTDNDLTPDYLDTDSDNDGVDDGQDNCRLVANSDQLDSDEDLNGDACQDDDDGDGIVDEEDNCQTIGNPDQIDTDSDGAGDACDGDLDGDGFDDDLSLGGSGCGCSSGSGSSSYLLLLLLVLPFVRRRRGQVAVLLLFTMAAIPTSSAQIFRNIDVERFELATNSSGVMDVEGASVLDYLDWDLSLWAGNASEPLIVSRKQMDGTTELGSLVTDRVGSELVAALGLGKRFQMAFAVPVGISQQGEFVPGTPMVGLASSGIGDLRLMPKYQLVQSERGLNIAIMPVVLLPTATNDAYLGEGEFGFEPEFIVANHWDALRVVANLGYRFRKNTRLADLQIDDDLVARVGAAYQLNSDRERRLEVSLSTSVITQARSPFSSAIHSPVEALAGVDYQVADQLSLFGGAGAGLVRGYGTPAWRALIGLRFHRASRETKALVQDQDGDGIVDADDECPTSPEDVDGFEDLDGCEDLDNDKDDVPDARDQCPDEPETKNGYRDEDGCPEVDSDGDGIVNGADECKNEAEDIDGFEDEDGCIDADNDGDGIADTSDQCPMEAETVNGVDDADGCPDQAPVADPSKGFPPPIEFRRGSAALRSVSNEMLDRLATVMNEHPEILVLEIRGHTSEEGSAEYNDRLSKSRAQAVVSALIKRGIEGGRLRSTGVGALEPIDTESANRRERNRRVEFKIDQRK